MERPLDQLQQKKALSILDGGGPGFMRGDGSGASFGTGMSPGEVFVASEGYKSVQDPSARGRAWTTGEIDTGAWAFARRARCLRVPGTPVRARAAAGFRPRRSCRA